MPTRFEHFLILAIGIGAFLCLLIFMAIDAGAVDPPCVNAVAADPAQILNATTGIKLCTPQLDVSGDPLVEGELTRCTIYADGAPYATLTTSTPGAYFLIAPPSTGAKRRAINATCEGPAGVSPSTATYDALMRRAAPGKPVMIP